MAPLLMHSDHVPPSARHALRAASSALPEHREAFLATAAHILYTETGISCEDVKELVGLPTSDCNC